MEKWDIFWDCPLISTGNTDMALLLSVWLLSSTCSRKTWRKSNPLNLCWRTVSGVCFWWTLNIMNIHCTECDSLCSPSPTPRLIRMWSVGQLLGSEWGHHRVFKVLLFLVLSFEWNVSLCKVLSQVAATITKVYEAFVAVLLSGKHVYTDLYDIGHWSYEARSMSMWADFTHSL